MGVKKLGEYFFLSYNWFSLNNSTVEIL